MDDVRSQFMTELVGRFGRVRSLPGSRSLFELSDARTRVYVRYSKQHGRGRTFFGLRRDDIRQLDGHPSVLCFLWDGQQEPLVVPYEDYEEVFRVTEPASVGQYKAQVYLAGDALELYIARAGRFNVEGRLGWQTLDDVVQKSRLTSTPELSHSQVQTMLGAIGAMKGHDIWIPASDRLRVDRAIAPRLSLSDRLPGGLDDVTAIVQEIDVIWIDRGSSSASAFFEVEHSTPIYSALLRFNDVRLTTPNLGARFSVVANDARHSLFVRQLARPTFRASGLGDRCTFLDYTDVFLWHRRLVGA
jgi:hypothetical protein